MNIVHVVESLALGGLERVVVSLTGIQVRHGHRVLVVCLFQEGVLSDNARSAGAAVMACGKTDGLDVSALRKMRHAIRSFHADVVHSHNAVAHYYAAVATLFGGVRTLLNTRHGMGSFPFSWRREFLFRLALAGSTVAVSVCDAAMQRFVSNRIIPRSKAVTVHNGTDVSVFIERNEAARNRLLLAFGVRGEPVVIGTVGRLSAAKDHAGLLAAMRRLVDDGVDALLVIVGDGELRESLREQSDRLQLGPRVLWLGARSDIPELLSGFDAFVLSSATEGYSLALVEACAAALPCVATSVGGNAEIVSDRISGLLVPAGDPARLAAAMAELCGSVPLRGTMGRNAREWALRNGTLDAMYQRYQALYERGRSGGQDLRLQAGEAPRG